MNSLRTLWITTYRRLPLKIPPPKSFTDGHKLERTVSGIYPHPVYEYRKRHPAQEPLNNIIIKNKDDNMSFEYKMSVFEIQEQLQITHNKDNLNNTK